MIFKRRRGAHATEMIIPRDFVSKAAAVACQYFYSFPISRFETQHGRPPQSRREHATGAEPISEMRALPEVWT
ncbi:hypothetical protein ElyMa_005535400 [Elysia marginata]|uniref:Uncharacterized protein n=1 Tax=Elysia marginata TaxID=1093978 RepID=A0AAV4EYH8_9GAST|nr:hypothetical protein ElyMa_005535400 [Elysia marginata]